MRRVATAINESESKLFDKRLEQLGMSEYEAIKVLVTIFINCESLDAAKLRVHLMFATKQVISAIEKDLKETTKNLL